MSPNGDPVARTEAATNPSLPVVRDSTVPVSGDTARATQDVAQAPATQLALRVPQAVQSEHEKLLAAEFKIRRWQRYVRFWLGQTIGATGMTVSTLEFLTPTLLRFELPPEILLPVFASSAALIFGRDLIKRIVDYAVYLRTHSGEGDSNGSR